jgi:hypothetical protein
VNRRLVVVVAIAAVLALFVGVKVGRTLLTSDTPPAARADVVRFRDPISKISIAYPATWRRLPQRTGDPDLALLLTTADSSAGLLMRVSSSGLDAPVTVRSLPIVRKLTDGLVGADQRVKQLVAPQAVVVGGLPGWRYRYTYGSADSAGAHDHYFLFKSGRLIQLVFQAVPAQRLPSLAPVFDRIAGTFRGRDA